VTRLRPTTRRRPRLRSGLALALIVLLQAACQSPTPEAISGEAADGGPSVADFYRGKQVDFYIGYSAGGGYDTYARLLARHLGKHIPGNPTVVPQNMPGAGSLTLANYLYNIAPKDGTAIGTFGRGLAMEPLLGGGGTRFDATRFTWLGSLNNEVSVCVSWHTSPVKTVDDLRSTELIVGGTGSGSDTDTFPVVLKNLLGLNMRLISGYPGGNDVLLAMERGEIDGRCGWSWATVMAVRPEWIEQDQVNVLVQMALEKHPALPEVPLVMDLARNDDERQAMELIFSRQVMGRPYAAPPDIPPARRDALRRALDAVVTDPEFLADAERIDLELNPVSGEEVEALVRRIYAASPAAVELASNAIRMDGGR
jgi:tripartite-type tricarboxylate transporter receptor subunit TctC